MSMTTPNLGLFKYDPSTDGAQTFNIQKALNNNWDKLDSSILLALAAAAPYSTSQTYALGAYCTRGGKLYKCTTAITSAETWTVAHWTETTMGAELVSIYTTLAKKATVEPDAVHILPLSSSASFVAGLQSTYSKSQFGKVSVHIACRPAESVSAYGTITVATLPEGYRPAVLTELYPGLSILYQSYNLGVWQVTTDGRILFTPTVAVSESASLHGSLSFDASA